MSTGVAVDAKPETKLETTAETKLETSAAINGVPRTPVGAAPETRHRPGR